jgi:hypothetical protein
LNRGTKFRIAGNTTPKGPGRTQNVENAANDRTNTSKVSYCKKTDWACYNTSNNGSVYRALRYYLTLFPYTLSVMQQWYWHLILTRVCAVVSCSRGHCRKDSVFRRIIFVLTYTYIIIRLTCDYFFIICTMMALLYRHTSITTVVYGLPCTKCWRHCDSSQVGDLISNETLCA